MEDDAPGGAPEWMVTFSDCMTLLLTFFVLLLSFSSFDDKVYNRMQSTMFKDLPTILKQVKRNESSVTQSPKITSVEQLEKGSEKPDNKNQSTKKRKRTDAPEHRDKKIFTCSSDIFFWGQGINLSAQGKEVLDTMAEFFENIPGLIVISEYDDSDEQLSINLGMKRSIQILNYFKSKGIAPDRFNISAATTLQQSKPQQHNTENQNSRTLEIVLLDRQVYK